VPPVFGSEYPDTLVAMPVKVAVMVPAEKLPEPSRATIALAVFRLVALDVTVNVEFPDWFAVKVADPESPVPDTPMDRVPLFTAGKLSQVGADVPLDLRYCPDVPAAVNAVFAGDD
jgi:hypothetical protein